eukprot:CAMPEP_0174893826 /NCGR_PEP_ID=MMETSP0167-20121228/8567_1 /TAXON_ID=38298 /ORGANISM="Rhodella maculata, Strain CCMP736" /LENGTH=227 /DNA_ID=CAMNT_0016132731 /DNA_START=478 /DNA_END=1161 /DNA_ORIENTATION=+
MNAVRGIQDLLKFIVDNELSNQHINYQDQVGGSSSPLYMAVEHQRLAIIPLLIEAGADVDQAFRGYTPLMENSFDIPNRRRDLCAPIANPLLDAGADPNKADFQGLTPLLSSNDELVRVLLERGAKVNHQASNGCTALSKAAMDGSIKIVRVLHQFGADHTLLLNDGRSPLFVASENGHLEVVTYLVENDMTSKKGIKAAEAIASQVKRQDVAAYLKSQTTKSKKGK